MMHHHAPYLIITDLDGSLLDHQSYRVDAAQSLLNKLQQYQVPVIFNTSKTLAELVPLRRQLKNTAPFVIENGGGIVLPSDHPMPTPYMSTQYSCERTILDHQLISFGTDHQQIKQILFNLSEKYPNAWQCFSDFDAQQMTTHTGLESVAGKLAQQRHFSEPLLWTGTTEQLSALKQELQQHQLSFVKGGRFYHVSSQHHKGIAVDFFREYYGALWQKEPIVIALGDGQNDVPMLEAADVPIVIRSPVNAVPRMDQQTEQKTYYTYHCGDKGWAEGIEKWLENYGLAETLWQSSIA